MPNNTRHTPTPWDHYPEEGYNLKIDLDRLAEAPANAQTIKLADLIDNTNSIVRHDPEFAQIYLKEKAALLEVLTRGDAALLDAAHDMVRWARQNLYVRSYS